MDTPKPETVSALTARIRSGLESWFRGVWVEGELSNVKLMSTSAHAYFTLKDAGAQLPCAFFNAARNPAAARILRDGAKLRVRGDLSVYPPRGAYQLVVRTAEPVGEGELMLRFEALKRRLADEGLFDQARKRPIPALPRTVGIVTSPTGAAIRDFLNVTRRRFAGLHVVLAPARVQGEGAAEEIAEAVRLLNGLSGERRPDVLVVGRGGGSLEDLWCFNEEIVARAVRGSDIPVISAVGHEIDFTICDFAADLRAPTPSAAAELVVKNRADLVATVDSLRGRLSRAARARLDRAKARVALAARSPAFASPAARLRESAQRVDLLAQRLESALSGGVQRGRLRLTGLERRPASALAAATAGARARVRALEASLAAMNPMAVLDRGYALVKDAEGRVVQQASGVSAGDRLVTVFRDGEVVSVALGGGGAAEPRRRGRPRPGGGGADAQPTLF